MTQCQGKNLRKSPAIRLLPERILRRYFSLFGLRGGHAVTGEPIWPQKVPQNLRPSVDNR